MQKVIRPLGKKIKAQIYEMCNTYTTNTSSANIKLHVDLRVPLV